MKSPYADLGGTRLDSGEFELTADDARRFLAAVHGEGAAPHPLHAFVACQGGIGLDLASLFRLVDFEMEDGPMLGAVRIRYQGQLAAGRRYAVSAWIEAVERKQGRRAGCFDLVRVAHRLEGQGQLCAEMVSTYILPRRTAS